mmetsp:Transcript_43249/g.92527  ORF Transcript_43249/g.92527 Transcript_43249/m.92527 type:complete len:226 (+) Transcript_43249:353-1030(+)
MEEFSKPLRWLLVGCLCLWDGSAATAALRPLLEVMPHALADVMLDSSTTLANRHYQLHSIVCKVVQLATHDEDGWHPWSAVVHVESVHHRVFPEELGVSGILGICIGSRLDVHHPLLTEEVLQVAPLTVVLAFLGCGIGAIRFERAVMPSFLLTIFGCEVKGSIVVTICVHTGRCALEIDSWGPQDYGSQGHLTSWQCHRLYVFGDSKFDSRCFIDEHRHYLKGH